ncbi:MAG TPA: class I SAM-dependent methyltransferase, partial [Cryptosporangiaceae bacterium]|nr:class I SAM-dependent methyltransferase [Cryptosporangiaceae bacterium]
PKWANILYHDWEAASYDEKWSISYDERCIGYARDRFTTIAGRDGWPYGRALELGCGTGFFLLNLMQAGVAERGSVTDISPGMVEVAVGNATKLGLDVDGRVADAESIPYDDDTFDLVVGHAVLHHIPDVRLALVECLRVLKPGGRFVFAGEPTRYGDVVARKLSQLTWYVATNVTRLPGLRGWRRPQAELDDSSRAAELEAVVDLHTFPPAELARLAREAGAAEVIVRTEELTASWLGWPVRTFECAVPPEKLGWRWAMFAYRGWMTLSAVDRHVWSRVVPAGLFYNALVTGVKPR